MLAQMQIGMSWGSLLPIVLSGVAIFVAVIVYTRIAGLRSFSKMSSFDFAMTVAVGTVMASVTIGAVPLLEGVVGLAVLYGFQALIAWGRRRFGLDAVVDNDPLLLMDGQTMLDDNLRRARITRDDVRAKLREANVLHPSQVRAVVLETTGDISVLHGDGDLDEAFVLDGVRR